jgi:hypothetical protein
LGAVSKPGLRSNFTYKPNTNFQAAEEAARQFAAFIPSAYKLSTYKITILEINEELPELDRLLQLRYKENYSRKPRIQHVKRQ